MGILTKLAQKSSPGMKWEGLGSDADEQGLNIKNKDSSNDLYGVHNDVVGMQANSIPVSTVNGSNLVNGNLIITGTIAAGSLAAGSVSTTNLVIGERSFATSVVVTATSKDAISWTSGNIYFSSSVVQAISSGTAIGLVGTTYLCTDGNSATLTTTTSLTVASESTRAILAIITPVSAGLATITSMRGAETTIKGDNVVTGSVASVDGRAVLDLNNTRLEFSDASNKRARFGKKP